jgi:histidyl-tRNA synthetase
LLLLLEALGLGPAPQSPDVYAVVPTAQSLPQAMVLLEQLRSVGLTAVLNPAGKDGPASMKSQFKRADASGARHAVVFGADELARGEVTVKNLRDAAAGQRCLAMADVATWGPLLRDA